MKNTIIKLSVSLLMLSTGFVKAQSILEHKGMDMKGDVEKVVMNLYTEVEVNEKDGAVKKKGPPKSKTNFYFEDGLLAKSEAFWCREDGSTSIQGTTVYKYIDRVLSKVELLDRHSAKPKVWKWHKIESNNGQILLENIFYDEDELRATLDYSYSTSPTGATVVDIEMFKPKEDGSQGHYHIEYNTEGRVIYSTTSVGRDTGIIYKLLHVEGDTLEIAETQMTRGGTGFKRHKTTVTSAHTLDDQGNILTELITGVGEESEPSTVYQEFEIWYKGQDIPVKKQPIFATLSGEYVIESHNRKLILYKSGKYELLVIDKTVKEPELVEDSEWLNRIPENGRYQIQAEKQQIDFGSEVTFDITFEINDNLLMLKPAYVWLKTYTFVK